MYWLIFGAVLIFAAALRYINIAENPGWYSDEGTLVEIAKNLLQGRFQYLVLNRSTLIAARLPLFPAILAGIFSFTGVHITPLRGLSAGLGILTVFLLMLALRQILRKKGAVLSLAAGLALAIYPKAVLYSRLGFSYNLLAPLVVGILWSLYDYLEGGKRSQLVLASMLVGLGGISDVMMFTLLPAVFLVALYKAPRDALLSLLGFLPFAVYGIAMWLLSPEAFLFDFNFTFFRLGGIPMLAQYPYIVFNYAALVLKDFWWIAAVAGLFLVQERRFRSLVLILFLIPLFALGRTAALPGLGYYYLVPLFPLLAVGLGSFLVESVGFAFRVLESGSRRFISRISTAVPGEWTDRLIDPGVFLLTALLLFVLVLSPFVMTGALGIYQARTRIHSEIDPVLVDVDDGSRALAYINPLLEPQDLVLASPALAWGIRARAADFQMSLAYQGRETLHFPIDIPEDRFSYPVDLDQAAYVIVDPIWTNWAAANMIEVQEMLTDLEEWPLIFSAGDVKIFQNPSH